MNVETLRFNASELCSRKLWELVNTEEGSGMSRGQLEEAVAELATRRRYLAELQRIGMLGGRKPEV
jgi:hypothetical protein